MGGRRTVEMAPALPLVAIAINRGGETRVDLRMLQHLDRQEGLIMPNPKLTRFDRRRGDRAPKRCR